jgi:hypothetical protein
VPHLASTSLIPKQGLLALGDALFFMVLDLPGEDIGVALEPACLDEPLLWLGQLGAAVQRERRLSLVR